MRVLIFLFFQVISFLIFSILTTAFFKNRFWARILSLFYSLIITAEVISILIGGSTIDYKFYVHFNLRDVLLSINYFLKEFLLVTILFFSSSFLIFKLSRRITQSKKITKPLVFIGAIFPFLFLTSKGGIFYNFYSTAKLLSTDKFHSFDKSLENLGIEVNEYVKPKDIKAEKGKNIIILSLESFEKGFLMDKMSHLAPNLTKYSKEWNFYEMPQSEGANWTSGSMYCLLTGVPAYFVAGANNIFKGSKDNQITGLHTILKKADYDLSYFLGKPEFSGMDDLLKAHHIKVKSENDFETKYPDARYGIHDKDLFEEAKKEILIKSSSSQPFAFFLSTTSSHTGEGLYDERMLEFVDPQKNKFEFMVKASDYMIGDFISFLRDNQVLENTVIYIFPDHLLMGPPWLKKNFTERKLYVITNADEKDLSYSTKNEILQIDVPKLILEGAKVKHNGKFLTDFIDEKSKTEFLQNRKEEILSLNESALVRALIDPSERKKISKDANRFIAHAGGKINNHTYTNSLEALNYSYQKGFKLFELDIIKTSDNIYVAAHDWKMWAKFTGFKGILPPSHSEFLKHQINGRYTPLDMNAINNWFSNHSDAILVTDKINTPADFSSKFIDKERLMMELFTMQAVKEGLETGIKSAMPSQRVLHKIVGNQTKTLKDLGVTDVAVSLFMLKNNAFILKDFKENGIRTYVYNVNSKEEKDENYVLDFEMNYIYGLYADEWDFDE